ncbi:MAG: hypothetical protein ABIG64_09400 [Candidatus Omnitrophota bacterium]
MQNYKFNNKKIGFLGDTRTIQYESFVHLCKNAQVEVIPFQESYANNPQLLPRSKILRLITSIKCLITGITDKKYKMALRDYFKKNDIKCIIAYWGTVPFRDIISIKKINPDVKIILHVLCHPLGLTRMKVFLQNLYFRYGSKYLDGIIYTSNIMKNYFQDKVLKKNIPSIISFPLLSKYFLPQKRKDKVFDHTPNLLFLGRMDWWAGQPTDNVLEPLENLIKAGIHIYHSDKTGDLPVSSFRHVFKPIIKLKEVIEFATQFDASLIIYNLKKCKVQDRFKLTIPDRLITAVTAGIPVAIPRDGYDACKEFLKPYQAVIEFTSFTDLKEKLEAKESLTMLANLAQENSRLFTAESQIDNLFAFIYPIIYKDG